MLSADELARTVTRETSVFARVTPADKLRLVEALQRAGHVVAVTGDGINDTPALRRADVGVAMGWQGTEAAREAADDRAHRRRLRHDRRAIGEGRRIADNIRKFVAFLLSANLGEVVLFAVAVLAGLGAAADSRPGADRQPDHGRAARARALARPGGRRCALAAAARAQEPLPAPSAG